MLKTLGAWKGPNYFVICPNRASDVLINIYAKNRCQWNGRLIETKFKQRNYANLKLVGSFGTTLAAKA